MTYCKTTGPDGSHTISFGSAILQYNLNSLFERIECNSFPPLQRIAKKIKEGFCISLPWFFSCKSSRFQFDFKLLWPCRLSKPKVPRKEENVRRRNAGLSGFSAVATVSVNHLLWGIWATCTLESQETERKRVGWERQGLNMRWREQCHVDVAVVYFSFGKWLRWFGQFAHWLSICIICQIWLWRRWLNVWPKRRRKENRQRNGQLPSCYSDPPEPAQSTLDITRKSAHRCWYEADVPDVASMVQMGWLQNASNMFWTLNPSIVYSSWTSQQYRFCAPVAR